MCCLLKSTISLEVLSISRVGIKQPSSQEFVAVNDSFGESGTPAQLMEKYKLNNQAIVAAVERVIKRK
jgi:transketolase